MAAASERVDVPAFRITLSPLPGTLAGFHSVPRFQSPFKPSQLWSMARAGVVTLPARHSAMIGSFMDSSWRLDEAWSTG